MVRVVLIAALVGLMALAVTGSARGQEMAEAPAESPEPGPQGAAESHAAIRTIVIDPGHGGDEVGAVGRSGVYEKDLALDIARRLRDRLASGGRFEVLLTRSSDQSVGLRERTAIANHASADLFVSIHLNSSRRLSAHGTETYFLSLTASDEEAMSLARAENRGGSRRLPAAGGKADDDGPDGEEGGDGGDADLEMILWDLAQSEHLARSSRLADMIQDEMNRLLGVSSRGIKQAPFTVLMGATMPAVLVEVAFLSNKEEEQQLESADFRSRVAVALESAILRFKDELERSGGPGPAGPRP